VVVHEGHIWLAHVGDSRAYLIRNGKLYRISEDHSLVAELVRQGTLTEEEARTFPDRNVILRALGIKPTVQPMVWQEGLRAKPGDVLVLCSDGLSDVIGDDTIREVAASRPPYEACEALIDAALDAHAADNVSVGVFCLDDAEVRAAPGRMTRETPVPPSLRGPK